MIKKITVALIIILVFHMTFAQAAELNMRIDENTVLNTARLEMYGMNNEWGNELGFWYDSTGKIRKEVLDGVAGYPFVLNRFAGGSSKWFLWKNSRGAIGDRQPYVQAINRQSGEPAVCIYGIVEAVKPILMVQPDAKFSYCVNPYFDSVENVADVVEYMTGDGTINYNGGENWAQKRIEDGLEEPVNVAIWEISNEADYQIGIDEYLEGAKRAIAAIRSVDPDAKIAAHTKSDDTSTVGYDWHRRVMKELGNDIDYIVMHKYYAHKGVARVAEKLLIDVENDLIDFGLADRVKIIYTEHASSYLGNYADRFENWPKNHSMSGVLNENDFFCRMWQHPTFYAANYHGFRCAVWNMVYEDSDGKVKPNALFDLYKLYVQKAVGDVVKVDLDGYLPGAASDVSGAAIRNKDGRLNIFLTNFSTLGTTDINFSFGKKYRLAAKTVISGDDIYANNYIDRKEISITTENCNDNTEFNHCVLPNIAVMILELEELK